MLAAHAHPTGDPAVPSPSDTANVSALASIHALVGPARISLEFANASAAWLNATWPQDADPRPALASVLGELTGRNDSWPEAAAQRLVDASEPGNCGPPAPDGRRICYVEVGQTPGLRGSLALVGPFGARALVARHSQDAAWRFAYDWASVTLPLRDGGGTEGTVTLWGNGGTQATVWMRPSAVQDAAREAFRSAGFPAPAFRGFSASQDACA